MIVRKLLIEYNKLFGYKAYLKSTLKLNTMLLPLFVVLLLSIIVFTFIYFPRNPQWRLVLYIYTFLFFTILAILIKKGLKKRHGGPMGYHLKQLDKLEKKLTGDFGVESDISFELLEKLVANEIEIRRANFKIPLMDIVQQLIVAVFISGMLTTSFYYIRSGEEEKGTHFLVLYIEIIGVLLFMGALLYFLRDFTTQQKLTEFSNALKEIKFLREIKKNSTYNHKKYL